MGYIRFGKQIRILHIITGLSTGGAEMMLLKLLQNLDRNAFDCSVVSLTDQGRIGEKVQQLGIPVFALNLSKNRSLPRQFIDMIDLVDIIGPDIIQTWLYHADLLGTLAALFAAKRKIVWNIRHSNLKSSVDKASTRFVVRICVILSHFFPDRIICNSFRGAKVHKKMGYCRKKMEIIHNGFDIFKYRPNKANYLRLRNELGISPDCPVIGMVARYHPQKNHRGFLESARLIQKNIPTVHFVFCGRGVSNENETLIAKVRDLKLMNVHFLGIRSDIEYLTSGFDIAVSNSTAGEGFSNVIGEAMACGVPCIATDVGDAGYLINGTGVIVPPGDPQLMAEACIGLLRKDGRFRQHLGEQSRKRIIENFSIQSITKKYEQLYFDMLPDNRRENRGQHR